MKKLFTAIKNQELELVKEILEKKPELVNCVAKMPPKADDGQSPLHIALRNGSFDIADYLIDKGADVNFIEIESVNKWKAPVVHDAIRHTIMRTKLPLNSDEETRKIKFDRSYAILEKMIAKGARVNSQDSYGNNCLKRACLDTKQVFSEENITKFPNMEKELSQVFSLLIKNGADIHEKTETRASVFAVYENEDIGKFLLI